MAAAPFKATLTFAQGSAAGPRKSWYCTVSDVAAAYYTFSDGNTFLTLPGNTPWYLVDINLSAAGTDTTNAVVYANGTNTGLVVVNASNVGTNYSRQFMQAPAGFNAGATVKFQQAA